MPETLGKAERIKKGGEFSRVFREGRSARLAAAARLLAAQPGLEDYVEQAERYLSEAYGGTVAADSVVPATDPTPTKEPKS